MIFDSVKNAELYSGLGADFREIFEFIKKTNLEKTPAGRYPLSGGIYYLVQEIEAKPADSGESGCVYEAHRKYIDLQYIIKGRELQKFSHLSALKEKTPYDGEKDVAFYEGPAGMTASGHAVLNSGFFTVYFPEDGHIPGLGANGDPEKILKAVFKIPV